MQAVLLAVCGGHPAFCTATYHAGSCAGLVDRSDQINLTAVLDGVLVTG